MTPLGVAHGIDGVTKILLMDSALGSVNMALTQWMEVCVDYDIHVDEIEWVAGKWGSLCC